ncbi:MULTISPECIES: FadR/GntR family transcriptional regulator [Streptosporangium]|uniref:DNA-binding FadR family transcriptional regulator n=1 Tax=Streptosporangium brasiliense TaxID=47480 RepID=A0ABT9QXE7_9ACTN|nr:FadR/GntR family transcriptional regulator [Streptosporangium brasiliense]MDP9861199.1 DNA-binding FadR family transcriptional regulator [Streptosporangium brasiliense]
MHPDATPPTTDDLSRMLGQVLDDVAQPAALGPVRVQSVATEVADRLMTAVAIGDYLPGERLPGERELATILDVSRATVREAIGRLQAVGIVEIKRGRTGGAYVRASWTEATASAVRRTLLPRWPELEQLFDLRCLVEGLVARTAALRRTDEDLAAMRVALAGYAAAGTLGQEQAADAAFHNAVLAATGNPKINALSRDLLTRVSLGFPVEPYGEDDPDAYQRALIEHRKIYEAIEAGDAEQAGSLAEEHFTLTSDMMRTMLERAQGRVPGQAGPAGEPASRVGPA